MFDAQNRVIRKSMFCVVTGLKTAVSLLLKRKTRKKNAGAAKQAGGRLFNCKCKVSR